MRYSAILVSAILALLSVGQAAPADTPAAPVEVITIPFLDANTLASLPNSTDSFAPADVDKKVARRAWETASLDKRQLPDRRYRVPDTDAWPLRTSGRWTRPDGVICSGVLVGPRHVLTARHCMGPNPGDMHFQPRYPAQNRGGAYVARVYQYPSSPAPCSQATDYVVLALGEELGHRAGWMGVGKFDGRYNAGQYCSLGYPGDRDNGGQMWATDGVSIHFLGTGCGNNVNQLSRNTLTAGGMSGGPLWGWNNNDEPYTIGPLVGVSSTESDWVGGDGVVALVSYARNDWP